MLSLARALAWWPARRRRRRGTGWELADLAGIEATDVAEMQSRFAAVVADEGETRRRRLEVRLDPLVKRAVPARTVEAAPGLPSARVRFADGTTVVVRGDVPGDVGVLALWVRRGSVPPLSCSTDAEGAHLVFGSPDGHRTVSLLVTGLDQPE